MYSERIAHRQKYEEPGEFDLQDILLSSYIQKQKLTLMILVVSGETGCGKTTQLPQFILEEEISSLRGSDCSIICTQPRRISAISVAARISSERGESLGETVGYQIRLESKRSAQTRLLFCTTGVLLQQLVVLWKQHLKVFKKGLDFISLQSTATNLERSYSEFELAWLVDDPNLTGVSHLLVDEIHERGMNEDFLLIILRDLLPCRPDLRLILMSATINANLFSRYFGDAPTIHIPGLTFPVTEFFLEDVLEKTCYFLKPEFENFQGYSGRRMRLRESKRDPITELFEAFGMVLPSNGIGLEKTELDHGGVKISIAMLRLCRGARLSELLRSVVGPMAFYLCGTVMSFQSGSIAEEKHPVVSLCAIGDVVYVAAHANLLGGKMAQFLEITPTLLSFFAFAFDADIDSVYKSYSTKTRQSLGAWSGLQLDLGLVEATIEYICRNEGNGAILVFLSGWDEISKLFDKLKANSIFGDPCKFLVLPLHGSMPTVDQREIFDRPPSNTRKIVLATNIAESSITIDDVVYVIDCGKAKETSYDALNKLACLLPSWISKASAHQRRGRAGRVQPGVCYRLYPKMIYDAMPQYQLPEILRTPLQQLCLQIKSLQLGVIESFLAKALQPPDALSVQNAIELLKTIGALNDAEELTPLGRHLCTLPLEPNIGKMLLMGSIFQCLNPALTIASALAHRNPFVLPMNRKEEADAAKRSFAGNSCSDHIALLKAFEGWKQAKRCGKERAFCWENFLSPLTMQMMEDMKNQFLDLLSNIGFYKHLLLLGSGVREEVVVVGDGDAVLAEELWVRSLCMLGNEAYNQYSNDLEMISAILCAGLYPNVVQCKRRGKRTAFYTKEVGKVDIHPASVNAGVHLFPLPFMVYGEKVKTANIFVRDSTLISDFALLMFGGNLISSKTGDGIEMLEGYLHFSASRSVLDLIRKLRGELDKILNRKIKDPGLDISIEGKGVVAAVVELLQSKNVRVKETRQTVYQYNVGQ
ncbi:hypothetical protein RJ639_018255, partial [Escallonia herrerae]